MKRFRFFTFLLCLVFTLEGSQVFANALLTPPPRLAFCLYSSSEAFNLAPTFTLLEKRGIPFYVLAFGAAQHALKKMHVKNLVALDSPLSELGQKGCWNISEKLSDTQKQQIFSLIKGSRLIFSGTASQIQVDIIKEAKQKGLDCLGYYDSFETLEAHAFLTKALPDLKALFVPTKSHVKKAHALMPKLRVMAVGKSEIDTLTHKIKNINLDELEAAKKRLVKDLNLDAKKSIILYCAGYGSDYEQGFSLFASAMRDMNSHKFNVLVSLHPAPHINGHFEEQIISRMCPNVKLVPKSFQSDELIAIADYVLTFTSSTLVNALAFNKHSAYLIPSWSSYTDTPIQAKWAPVLYTPKMLWDWIAKAKNSSFELRSELPENSAKILSDSILTYLDKIEKKLP